MKLISASFNVLADAYLSYGDYSHVAPDLLVAGARLSRLVQIITDLPADIIGLQEVERPLVNALSNVGKWEEPHWSPKQSDAPDGCLILVRRGLKIVNFATRPYNDGSGHIAQFMTIGKTVFVNSHIKWSRIDDPHHSGIAQTQDLLSWLSEKPQAVILADCNDRPGGPVRALIDDAGFTNACQSGPTAFVNQMPAALDLVAVRGVYAEPITTEFHPKDIPNVECPSDHIPVMASVTLT